MHIEPTVPARINMDLRRDEIVTIVRGLVALLGQPKGGDGQSITMVGYTPHATIPGHHQHAALQITMKDDA